MSVISGFIAGKIILCPKSANLSLLSSFSHPGHLSPKIWTNGLGVGLGCRELQISQQFLSNLPALSQQFSLVISADARLDNRDELITKLSLSCPRSSQDNLSDGLIILTSYIKWGKDCTKHLLGDFAFAIWNNQTQELFAARDQLGIRPFFYHHSDNFFAFSSEIKGLLQLPHVLSGLNDDAIADYLIGNYENVETTVHQRIKRLPPAHSLLLKNNRITLYRYWSLERQRTLIFPRDEDYAVALRQKIVQAITCRLQTEFPVGAMLSGGLDSSTIVAIANDILREKNTPFSTYSYVLPSNNRGEITDERSFIDCLVQKTGNEHYHVTAPGQGPFQRSDDYFNILCEPLRDSYYFIQESIYKKASLNNVRVLLTGIGGDLAASLSGTACFAHLASQFRLKKLYSLLKLRQIVTNESFVPLILRQIVARLLPNVFSSAYRFLLKKKPLPKEQYAYSQKLYATSKISRRLKQLAQQRRKQGILDHQSQISYSVTFGHISSFMEHRSTTAASFGLSVCHPYLDLRIIEFCMSLPHEQFVKDGWHRSIFRRAIKGIVPKEISYRPDKQPFIPDYTQRILQDKKIIVEQLTKNNPLIARYLDKDIIINYLNHICSSEHAGWHPNTLTLLGDGISLAAFLYWFKEIDLKKHSLKEF